MSAAAIAPIAAAAVDAISSYQNSKQDALQAALNRRFQAQMYERQVKDNRENWRMQVEYADPSNELARITKAGLNPLLMYGEGGLMSTVSTPSGGSLPSGSASHPNFQTNFGQAAYQAAMMSAQIRNLESVTDKNIAETRETEQKTENVAFTNLLNKLTKDLQVADKYNDFDLKRSTIRKYDNEVLNQTMLTSEQLRTMAQNRLYQIKQFQLTERQVTEQLQAMWQDVATGRINANAAMKNACSAWLNATTNKWATEQQVGILLKKLPFELGKMKMDINNLTWDAIIKRTTNTEKQVGILRDVQKALNLYNFGSEEISSTIAPVFLLTGKLSGRIN